MVERAVWDREVGGSSPLSPTFIFMTEDLGNLPSDSTFEQRYPGLSGIPKESYPQSVLLSVGGRAGNSPIATYGAQLRSALESAIDLAGSPVQEVIIGIQPASELDLAYATNFLDPVVRQKLQILKNRGVKLNWFGDISGTEGSRVMFEQEIKATKHNRGMSLSLVFGENQPPISPSLVINPVASPLTDSSGQPIPSAPLFTKGAIEGAMLNYASQSHSASSE